jgi:hypothetical protein
MTRAHSHVQEFLHISHFHESLRVLIRVLQNPVRVLPGISHFRYLYAFLLYQIRSSEMAGFGFYSVVLFGLNLLSCGRQYLPTVF